MGWGFPAVGCRPRPAAGTPGPEVARAYIRGRGGGPHWTVYGQVIGVAARAYTVRAAPSLFRICTSCSPRDARKRCSGWFIAMSVKRAPTAPQPAARGRPLEMPTISGSAIATAQRRPVGIEAAAVSKCDSSCLPLRCCPTPPLATTRTVTRRLASNRCRCRESGPSTSLICRGTCHSQSRRSSIGVRRL